MKETIRCAVIGLGRIASALEDDALREKPASHAGAIAGHPETRLAGGFDRDREACRRFAERWNLEESSALFDDALEMLRTIKPEILHIATHEDSHLDYLSLAVRESVPVVVLEKPVSRDLGKARRMANRLGTTRVVVNHERRYSRDYLRVREHIRKRTYGELLSVTGRLYMGRTRPVKAILLHDGTHMLDIIPFLTGKPLKNLKVRAAGSSGRNLYALADSGGAAVLCEFGNSRDHLVFELELSFATGRIRVGNGVYEELESRESTFYEGMRSLYPAHWEPVGQTAYFSGMMADAVKVFRDPGTEPVSSYRDGLESLILVQKLRRKC